MAVPTYYNVENTSGTRQMNPVNAGNGEENYRKKVPMARYDFRQPRLYVDTPLRAGGNVPLDRDAANYLRNVLRLKGGDGVLAFNGRDGEWQASLAADGKKFSLAVAGQTRPQPAPADLHYIFAPIKHARLDYMVQKAVELGASALQPVITQHTQVTRVNTDRMHANAIEAAQQCGVLALPAIAEPVAFKDILARLAADRVLIFCDEETEVKDPVAALGDRRSPLAVLIGPEGGFSEDERAALLKRPNTVRLSLGPRILRADTAAVAALTLVQAVLGDWRDDAP
jgi:16S rRNA (uracil1498-N3)-methyltransferase